MKTVPTQSRTSYETGRISYVNATYLCSLQKNLCSKDPFRSNHPARHPTRPATRPGSPPDPARHSTLPATRPGQPPHPAQPACSPCLPSLPACPFSSGMTASQTLQSASAVLVLLRRLYVRGASQSATPSNILHTPSTITHTHLSYIAHPISYSPHLILPLQYSMYPIKYSFLPRAHSQHQQQDTFSPQLHELHALPLCLFGRENFGKPVGLGCGGASSQTHQQGPVVYKWCLVKMSESCSNLCLCFGLVRLLPVSKFSLCHSASTVTKSLCSPVGASCLQGKNANSCVHILNRQENPALRHNKYVPVARDPAGY